MCRPGPWHFWATWALRCRCAASHRWPGPCCCWPTIFRGSTSPSCTRRATAALSPSPTCKAWPLVGTLATAAGTLYIERGARHDAMRVVQQMADALRQREVLAVFPEGTTGDGHTLLPFHANLLQAALAADAPVLPVGLRYTDRATGAASQAPSYVGDDSLLGSMWRTACAPPIVAVVHYGTPQQSQGLDRRAWSAVCTGPCGGARRSFVCSC